MCVAQTETKVLTHSSVNKRPLGLADADANVPPCARLIIQQRAAPVIRVTWGRGLGGNRSWRGTVCIHML